MDRSDSRLCSAVPARAPGASSTLADSRAGGQSPRPEAATPSLRWAGRIARARRWTMHLAHSVRPMAPLACETLDVLGRVAKLREDRRCIGADARGGARTRRGHAIEGEPGRAEAMVDPAVTLALFEVHRRRRLVDVAVGHLPAGLHRGREQVLALGVGQPFGHGLRCQARPSCRSCPARRSSRRPVDRRARRHCGRWRIWPRMLSGGFGMPVSSNWVSVAEGASEASRPIAFAVLAVFARIKRGHAGKDAEVAAQVVDAGGHAVVGGRTLVAEAFHDAGGPLDRRIEAQVVVLRAAPLAAEGGDLQPDALGVRTLAATPGPGATARIAASIALFSTKSALDASCCMTFRPSRLANVDDDGPLAAGHLARPVHDDRRRGVGLRREALHDRGAELGEHASARRPGQHVGHVEHRVAGQRELRRRHARDLRHRRLARRQRPHASAPPPAADRAARFPSSWCGRRARAGRQRLCR